MRRLLNLSVIALLVMLASCEAPRSSSSGAYPDTRSARQPLVERALSVMGGVEAMRALRADRKSVV